MEASNVFDISELPFAIGDVVYVGDGPKQIPARLVAIKVVTMVYAEVLHQSPTGQEKELTLPMHLLSKRAFNPQVN